jgi:hypothetical protein
MKGQKLETYSDSMVIFFYQVIKRDRDTTVTQATSVAPPDITKWFSTISHTLLNSLRVNMASGWDENIATYT